MRAGCPLAATLLLTLFTGCASHRFLRPDRPPPPAEAPADLTHVAVALSNFDITNQSALDLRDGSTRDKMRLRFEEYLRSSASFGLYISDAEAAPFVVEELDAELIQLDVLIAAEETAERTIVFDGLFFYPFLGTLPFTPQWGEAIVTGTARVRRNGINEAPVVVRVSAPYSIIFYSWYRVAPIEEAFTRAHGVVFKELASRVVKRIGTRPAEEPPPEPEIAAPLVFAETSSVATASASVALLGTAAVASSSSAVPASVVLAASEPRAPPKTATRVSLLNVLPPVQPRPRPQEPPIANVILPPDQVGVIFRPIHREREPGFLSEYLGALGGVEASLTGGVANIQSRAVTSRGQRETVGTGQATSSGYRVSLFKPPSVTGFFYPPTVGFLSQTITITGFRDDVPLFTPSGSNTIPAVATDPATGAPVDAGEPIAYRLKLRSGHIGQSLGLNLVIGDENVQLFSTVVAGLNVFEVRHSDVRFHESHVKGMSVVAFRSGNLGAQAGIVIPDLHLALRAAAQFEWYASFSYPDRVEFQARTAFNPEKQIYERERVFVDGASLFTLDWQLSAVMLF